MSNATHTTDHNMNAITEINITVPMGDFFDGVADESWDHPEGTDERDAEEDAVRESYARCLQAEMESHYPGAEVIVDWRPGVAPRVEMEMLPRIDDPELEFERDNQAHLNLTDACQLAWESCWY